MELRRAAGGWLLAGLAALVAPSAARAGYFFDAISSNSGPSAAALESQLYMVVEPVTGQSPATVWISNNLKLAPGGTISQGNFSPILSSPLASSICDIYFDFGANPTAGSALSILGQSSGVSFGLGAKPANLPGGNDPKYSFTADLSADSKPAVAPNGVNPGEWIKFQLKFSGFNLINGLNNGSFRVGLHVQSIGPKGKSDSFINFVPSGGGGNSVVPEPGTFALFGLGGLGMLGAYRRRRAAA